MHLLATGQDLDNILSCLLLVFCKLVLVIDDVELFLQQKLLHGVFECLAGFLVNFIEVVFVDLLLDVSLILHETFEVLDLYL